MHLCDFLARLLHLSDFLFQGVASGIYQPDLLHEASLTFFYLCVYALGYPKRFLSEFRHLLAIFEDF